MTNPSLGEVTELPPGITPERVRELLADATPGPWYTNPHVHGAAGCRCLSCDDPPAGWYVDHDHTLDCSENIARRSAAGQKNDFGRDLTSCDNSDPLLPYADAALAAAAPDIAKAYLAAAGEVDRLRAERDERLRILREELAPFQVTPNADFDGIISTIRDAVACEEERQELITRYACPECHGSGGFGSTAFAPCGHCGGDALDGHDAEGRAELAKLAAENERLRQLAQSRAEKVEQLIFAHSVHRFDPKCGLCEAFLDGPA